MKQKNRPRDSPVLHKMKQENRPHASPMLHRIKSLLIEYIKAIFIENEGLGEWF
jgi:hypothetical protein